MAADAQLTESIYQGAVNAFNIWRGEHPDERVFVFALSTLDDAQYVSASLNTEESLQRRLAKNNIEPSSPDARYLKWGPWDWEHEYISPEAFSAADKRIQEIFAATPEEKNKEFRSAVFDSMLAALVKLREEGVIANAGNAEGVILFATIYDSYSADELHRKSAELLNRPEDVVELLEAVGG